MSGAIAFYRQLRDAGVDEQTAMLCAEEFDKAVKIEVAAILEPRRAKDRERKRPRNSKEPVETPESMETAEPLPLPPSPQTPQPPTPAHGVCSSRPRKADDFDRFWEAYPRKTDKAAARKAWPRAIGRASLETMIAAVERQRTWEQWQRGFVPHAATWLNRERWTDEEPETPEPRKAHEQPSPSDAKLAAKQANYERAWTGSERAFGRDRQP